jgi:hypothetical protein
MFFQRLCIGSQNGSDLKDSAAAVNSTACAIDTMFRYWEPEIRRRRHPHPATAIGTGTTFVAGSGRESRAAHSNCRRILLPRDRLLKTFWKLGVGTKPEFVSL